MKFYINIIIFLLLNLILKAQPESEVAQIKTGRIWTGVTANGSQGTFDFRAGFFPNDYDILQHRGQGNENYNGSGIRLACTDWVGPDDSLYPAAVFGPQNDYLPAGKVIEPITSYIRYKYPEHTINGQTTGILNYAVYDPSKFTDGTYDQVVEVTYKNVLGVDVKRRILSWSQTYNDNYLIIELEFTNTGVDKISPEGEDIVVQDTLKNFYINFSQGSSNNYFSNGSKPSPPSNERPNFGYVWQHYYGAKPGDSMRVFYFYSADDPNDAGDDMGAPVTVHNGRLVNTNFVFYSILHASKQPFLDPSTDEDDPLQPKVTYIGTETRIPNPGSGEDPYGSKNFWAIRGGFSEDNLMAGSYPDTYHMFNNDELGNSNFSQFPGGTISGVNSKNFSSFGPYTFPPNHKIKIVYAVGIAGIGLEKSAEIGKKWLDGTLENPPNMPDPNTGWLPSNFAFPPDASEQDKIKDRWISMGIDSVMLTAWRAKWNYEHNYQIPQAPPPPEYFKLRSSGQYGVVLEWRNIEAENMDNFAGYRIMRKLSDQDTVFYEEIYSSGPEDKASEHVFGDTSAIPASPYYYYIQTKAKIDENDLNADPTTRGKMMYSSRSWIPNIMRIDPPPRHIVEGGINKIRIVPNPYNINDPLIIARYSDETIQRRQLNFFNLPEVVTIKIYTENGDLVKTLEHNESFDNTGLERWNMITDNQQVISSGVYIAVFQTPNGETAYQKFIVVR